MTVTRAGRRRIERWRHRALVIGFSFALGALADTALTWRLHEFDLGAGLGRSALSDEIAPERAVADNDGSTAAVMRAPKAVPGSDAHEAVSGTSGVISRSRAIDMLSDRDLLMPVEGIKRSELRDTYAESRSGGRAHEALDIMAARGTPVRAVEDGTVARLFESKAGGLTIYQFDPTGQFCYYYAHLDRYAAGLKEHQIIRRGDVIGFVGSTGNASPDAPHLHFAVFRLGPERQWWKGEPIDPFPVLARK